MAKPKKKRDKPAIKKLIDDLEDLRECLDCDALCAEYTKVQGMTVAAEKIDAELAELRQAKDDLDNIRAWISRITQEAVVALDLPLEKVRTIRSMVSGEDGP